MSGETQIHLQNVTKCFLSSLACVFVLFSSQPEHSASCPNCLGLEPDGHIRWTSQQWVTAPTQREPAAIRSPKLLPVSLVGEHLDRENEPKYLENTSAPGEQTNKGFGIEPTTFYCFFNNRSNRCNCSMSPPKQMAQCKINTVYAWP